MECGAGGRAEDGTIGADALSDAEALVGDGRGAVMIPVVEIRTSLAGDGEGVFKTGSGDESDARAFALEQGIGGDGGAVAARLGSSGVEGSLRTRMRLPMR